MEGHNAARKAIQVQPNPRVDLQESKRRFQEDKRRTEAIWAEYLSAASSGSRSRDGNCPAEQNL
jgi:hypothetical protein